MITVHDDYSALLSLSSDFSNLCNGCLQNELPNNLNSSVGEVLADLNHDDNLNSTTNDLCDFSSGKVSTLYMSTPEVCCLGFRRFGS